MAPASKAPSPGHDIVVIGASAGGLEPLMEIAGSLLADLDAAVFVVIHASPSTPGVLPQLLNRAGPLWADSARDGETIEPGRIYLPPPDCHLLIKPGVVAVTRGPKENGFRPAVDPLFRTAARSYGTRVVGVILSGALDDGTHGLSLIKSRGGKAIVQDPHEAFINGMPLSACRYVDVDHILPASEIGAMLVRLSREPPPKFHPPGSTAMDPDDQHAPDIAEHGSHALASGLYQSPPSAFTCPECGGALWEVSSEQPTRYRCHVGHSFTGEGLLSEQEQELEVALWTAVRALDENAALNRRMAKRAEEGKLAGLETAYRQRAESAQEQANVIRQLLVSPQGNPVESMLSHGHENAQGGAAVKARTKPAPRRSG